jgi:hypothetical protein
MNCGEPVFPDRWIGWRAILFIQVTLSQSLRRKEEAGTGTHQSIAVEAAAFKLRPDVHAGPQQIRSYTRQGREPSSTSPTVLREEARKTPPPELSAVRKVHRGDPSLTQRGCLLVDEVSCFLTPKGRAIVN